jgi:NADH dehydrogenase [ubiquinone] 1 alpha subcomplex assembly factor 7
MASVSVRSKGVRRRLPAISGIQDDYHSRRHLTSSSKDKDKKRQAMQRQKPQPAAPFTDQTNVKIQLPDSSSRIILDPSTAPLSTFSSSSSPTRLQLTPRDDWMEQYQSWQSSSQPLNLDKLSGPTPEGIMRQDISGSLVQMQDMYDPSIHLPYAPQDWKGYEPATPLSTSLQQRIGVMGRPITTAEFMRQALTHPLYGYYTNPPKSKLAKSLQDNNADDWDYDNDDENDNENDNENDSVADGSTLIGPGGDFVTAPEVSHVFGHSICVWLYTQWKDLKEPSRVQLVELGPGRGTLMVDILQLATSKKLGHFGKTIDTVHLVEASLDLREKQQASLEKALGPLIDFEFVVAFQDSIEKNNKRTGEHEATQKDGKIPIRVQWHDDFSSFQHTRNKDMPVFMVLQEFIDALPVHVFQKSEQGWRERLVDVVSREDNPPNPDDTPLVPRLRQVLAPDVTPALELLLPADSPQYKNSPVGTVVEICPEAIFLIQDMETVLDESGGVALMIDYGQEGTGDTLRAFSNHKQVSLTSYPGQVDVTADVDFFVLKNSLKKSAISAFGPITQGEFLMTMGASDMVIALIEEESTTEEQAQTLMQALKYLVMPEHMGEKYKVLALGRKRDGIFAPPAFEK